jgi:hypothetical protein
MLDELGSLVEQLRRTLARFEPGVSGGDEATQLLRLFAEGERLCAAGKVLAAGRVSETEVWRRGGWRSLADWMAQASGAKRARAAEVVEVAARLRDCPLAESEMRAGRLSEAQAHAVVDAVCVRPDLEQQLVDFAKSHTVRQLEDECRRVKVSREEAESEHERLRRTRGFRTWTGKDGAFCFSGRATPEAGAEFAAAIEERQSQVIRTARANGERDSFDAYALDALVELVTEERGQDTRRRTRPGATVVVHVAYEALIRGSVADGEECEIAGVGPIPVVIAKRLMEDSILRVLVTKGGVPIAVTPGKRTVPPALRVLLEARDRECVVPGCDVTRGLQIDHREDFARGGPTTEGNCALLCLRHHDMKTYQGWRLGGAPGAWTWSPADDYRDPEPPDPNLGTMVGVNPWTGRAGPGADSDPQRRELLLVAPSGTAP